ncbi:unnamed protein product [Oikopleura dioica]|uniref:Tantalus-like domain-containing protein n=1 Tax=Oikopleura dioica TaxID=34765 RepID=E4WXK4_OIKDI|nr:unnamed protein product [Oikopleura dioica]
MSGGRRSRRSRLVVPKGVEVADPGEKENILSPLEKPRDAQAGFALPLKDDLPASPIEKNFLSPIAPLQEHQASINALSPLESGCSGTEQKKQQVLIKIPKKLNKAIYPRITKLGLPKPARPIFKKKKGLSPEEYYLKPYSPPKAHALPTIIDEEDPKAESRPFSRNRCRFIKFAEDHTTRKTKRKLKTRQQRMCSKISDAGVSQKLDEKIAKLDKDIKE